MAQQIIINGNTMETPDQVVANCWEDRTKGLLTREAGLALMPYMNESARAEAAYQKELDRLEYGDPNAPAAPAPLYDYFVDGEVAFPAAEVTRKRSHTDFAEDGEPTGRIYMSTMSELLRRS